MTTAQIQFLDEIPIDERHTLHQLLGRFQTVRDGLPELVKNAKDQYARRGIGQQEERPIVVITDSSHDRLAVLDFAGAAKDDFEHWLVWSDPKASRIGQARDIEGRHGNGGKGFMVRGSVDMAFLESIAEGRRTKMGFRNDAEDVQYFPGYFVEAGEPVDDVAAGDVRGRLDAALDELGVAFADLPEAARTAFESQQVFTLARLDGVRDWVSRPQGVVDELVADLPRDLVMHPQAALTIETCSVFVMLDGYAARGPLERELPKPLEGFEKPWRLRVPDFVIDPETRSEVATGEGTKRDKYLHLYTSSRSLRMPGKRPLNVVRVRNARNILASWSVADLYPHAESAFVFGELRVPALELDHIAGADRTTLADTALVRALREWVGERIAEQCAAIQQAMAEDYSRSDRRKVNRELRQFRRLMGNFLSGLQRRRPIPGAREEDEEQEVLLEADDGPDSEPERDELEGGTASEGTDKLELGVDVVPDERSGLPLPASTAGSNGPTPSAARSRYTLESIDLEPRRDRLVLAAGTRVPLVFDAIEVNEAGRRRRARNPQMALAEGDSEVFGFDDEGSVLHARAPGSAIARLEARAGDAVSETVEVAVVACSGARFENVPSRLLRQGERVQLDAVFSTDAGDRNDVLIEAWLDEPEMGRIDREGVFTAGRYSGTATVRLRFGPKERQTVAVEIDIGEEFAEERPVRRIEGGRIPHILVCGTMAPGMEHFPPAQRTVQGGPHEPTIIDFEPQFEHVIWINPSSEESVRVREGRGGRRGVAGIGTKPYLRFLAIKCFEILKRLYVRHRVEDRLITESEFRRLFASAEIECAPFVDAAYSVAESLAATGGATAPSMS